MGLCAGLGAEGGAGGFDGCLVKLAVVVLGDDATKQPLQLHHPLCKLAGSEAGFICDGAGFGDEGGIRAIFRHLRAPHSGDNILAARNLL